jgi:hypothetical protein
LAKRALYRGGRGPLDSSVLAKVAYAVRDK